MTTHHSKGEKGSPAEAGEPLGCACVGGGGILEEAVAVGAPALALGVRFHMLIVGGAEEEGEYFGAVAGGKSAFALEADHRQLRCAVFVSFVCFHWVVRVMVKRRLVVLPEECLKPVMPHTYLLSALP